MTSSVFGKNNLDIEAIHNNNVDIDQRIIYFSPESDEVDHKSAIQFLKNLDILNFLGTDDITLKIVSNGGDWSYGMAIFDGIKNSKSTVVSESYGQSVSMSSIIPQACYKRLISNHCDFMVHYGTYSDSGDFIRVHSALEYTQNLNEKMVKIYIDRMKTGKFYKDEKMTSTKLTKFLKDKLNQKTDWWMSAEESVYYGFMDEIL